MNVGVLDDALTNAVGGERSWQRTDIQARLRKYAVVAVLNPGDGPDEVHNVVTNIVWDHDLGVLRLEVEN